MSSYHTVSQKTAKTWAIHLFCSQKGKYIEISKRVATFKLFKSPKYYVCHLGPLYCIHKDLNGLTFIRIWPKNIFMYFLLLNASNILVMLGKNNSDNCV